MKNKIIDEIRKSGKLDIPKMDLRASFIPGTYDEKAGTIEVMWSSGSKGLRRTWSGDYYEELSMKKGDVRLERLNLGAAVLDNHNGYSLRDSIGVVEKAWIKSGEGYATLRLSEREDVAGIVQDIVSGIIRNVSVRYIVHEFKDVSNKNDEIPTLRAVDWEPMELSFVNIPFEATAQSRSNNDNYFSPKITREESSMDPKTEEQNNEDNVNSNQTDDQNRSVEPEKPQETKVSPEKPQETIDHSRTTDHNKPEDDLKNRSQGDDKVDAEQIRKEERERSKGINEACRTAGLPNDFAQGLIDNGTKMDKARELIFNKMKENQSQTKTNPANVQVNDCNQRNNRIEGATNAILSRATSGAVKVSDMGRGFAGMSLIRMAEEVLRNQGMSVQGMSPMKIADRALHSTSDFPQILANVVNKTLRDAYAEAPQTIGPITNEVEVNDFKEISRVQLGETGKLEEVNEAGEFKRGTLSEAAEKYFVKTYGKIIGITRQMIVNDDLNAFARLAMLYGRRSRDLESDLIFDIIKTNPLMADGNALFSAAHGNLITGPGTALGVDSLGVGRAKMRVQKGLDGAHLNLAPRHLYVPAALETKADQLTAQITPDQASNDNPFRNRLMAVTESRLDADSALSWYLFAEKAAIDIFEIARLAGEAGPVIEERMGFERDGVDFKVRYDIGAKAIDYRGAFKNVGASS